MRRVILALLVAVCSVSGAAAAEPKPAASGKFDSSGVAWDVNDAYAFRGKSAMGRDDVIVVAITNGGFPREVIDGWFDRKQALETKFRGNNSDTVLVYLEFTPQGEYQGLSYYIGSGNGCGWCSGGVASTVKLVGGKLVGGLKYTSPDRVFDVTLDVPIASDDHGPALPAGGGEPGRVYLAYHAALKAGDTAGLKKTLDDFMLKQLAKGEQTNDVAGFLAWLGGQRYLDTVKVDKGFASADKAVLLVSGSGSIGDRKGQVTLVREKSGWRVSDEAIGFAGE
jgi:hypothetical protein